MASDYSNLGLSPTLFGTDSIVNRIDYNTAAQLDTGQEGIGAVQVLSGTVQGSVVFLNASFGTNKQVVNIVTTQGGAGGFHISFTPTSSISDITIG